MINIGIIGIGNWGRNLVNNFKELSSVKYLCDKNKEGPKIISDYHKILQDRSVDAVAIATDIDTHYQIAKDALLSGKHVFVEKPLCIKKEEVDELYTIAKRKDLVLFVDYLLIYSAPVKKIKELIKDIGNVYLLKINRMHPERTGQKDNAVLDLLPHDLSVLYYIFQKHPKKVLAEGVDECVSLLLKYDSFIANISLSRISYDKERSFKIYGDKGVIVWDDLKKNNIRLVKEKEFSFSEKDVKGPLFNSCSDFIRRCKNKDYLDSELSVQISKIFKSINKSKKEKKWIKI